MKEILQKQQELWKRFSSAKTAQEEKAILREIDSLEKQKPKWNTLLSKEK